MRAGSRVLEVFENPLHVQILRAHAEEPLRLADLQGAIAWSPETTLRVAVGNLCDFGALEKKVVARTPYAVATGLTAIGRELLLVADVLDAWLRRHPNGPIEPDGNEARVAIKALAGGWSSMLMRALAGGPFTLTELDRLIPDLSYPALERRLSWMRGTGQVEVGKKTGKGTPYLVTDWLRRAIAPLSVAARCERRHMADESGSITSIEVEAAFLLTLPLAPLPSWTTGGCALAVQLGQEELDEERVSPVSIAVEAERGVLISYGTEVAGPPTSWAVGTTGDWLDAVIDGRFESLRIGGADPQLPADIVNGVHFALFEDADRD